MYVSLIKLSLLGKIVSRQINTQISLLQFLLNNTFNPNLPSSHIPLTSKRIMSEQENENYNSEKEKHATLIGLLREKESHSPSIDFTTQKAKVFWGLHFCCFKNKADLENILSHDP